MGTKRGRKRYNGSGTCGGKSQSLIDGREEYESQEAEYEECEAKKQH
jgi:hypothetical protein